MLDFVDHAIPGLILVGVIYIAGVQYIHAKAQDRIIALLEAIKAEMPAG